MKKILLGMLSAVFVVAAVGCSSSTSSKTDCSNGNIVMVTDIGGADDDSFNEGTYAGIQKLVKESDGVCSDILESENEASYIPNLNTATEAKPDLVVAAGFKLEADMKATALANPDQKYLIIDAVISNDDGSLVDNVVNALFAANEGSYLAGVAAAMKAKEDGYDTVGFIGGMEVELIIAFGAGFEAGVKSVDPNMNVLVSYVGDFKDAPGGLLEAQKMYDSGAYVIYHAAGGSGSGVISEAKARYEAAAAAGTDEGKVWVVGVDEDQYDLGVVNDGSHSVVLTSMEKKVGVVAYEISKAAINGDFSGGQIITYTLENGGVGLPEKNPNLNDSILAAVEDAKKAIIAGEVEVPTTFK